MVILCFQDGTPTSKTFEHVTSEIGAEEAEEVGVEHLLRWSLGPSESQDERWNKSQSFGLCITFFIYTYSFMSECMLEDMYLFISYIKRKVCFVV